MRTTFSWAGLKRTSCLCCNDFQFYIQLALWFLRADVYDIHMTMNWAHDLLSLRLLSYWLWDRKSREREKEKCFPFFAREDSDQRYRTQAHSASYSSCISKMLSEKREDSLHVWMGAQRLIILIFVFFSNLCHQIE